MVRVVISVLPGVGGIRGAILDVRGAETVELAAVFCVVDIVLEEKFLHLEEGGASEERIASGLMLGP